MLADTHPIALLAILVTLTGTGCRLLPTGPSELGGVTGPAGPAIAGDGSGVSQVAVVGVTPSAGGTLTLSPLEINVRYSIGSPAQDVRVWTCVGRSPTTIILSSCRDTGAQAASGTVVHRPSIYWFNGRRAVSDTQFISTFLVEGDILSERRPYHPLEVGEDALTSKMLARHVIEHAVHWAD